MRLRTPPAPEPRGAAHATRNTASTIATPETERDRANERQKHRRDQRAGQPLLQRIATQRQQRACLAAQPSITAYRPPREQPNSHGHPGNEPVSAVAVRPNAWRPRAPPRVSAQPARSHQPADPHARSHSALTITNIECTSSRHATIGFNCQLVNGISTPAASSTPTAQLPNVNQRIPFRTDRKSSGTREPPVRTCLPHPTASAATWGP